VSERRGPVLIVDDEADIRNLIAMNLRREGFEVVTAEAGAEALEAARDRTPSLVVLDLMLPDLPGTEVCRRLRADAATRDVPVLMLTARSEEIDRVVGFEVGADDYVTKPFSVRELMLRVKAILRRRPEAAEEESSPAIERAGLKIDVGAHRVWVDGQEIALTATEFKLLLNLARQAGRVRSRGQLLQEVWEMPPHLNTRTVDTHVKRLREKLGSAAALIETVRGVGYRFAE
jgi:two-component system phosphate regulon response regulator PhoB